MAAVFFVWMLLSPGPEDVLQIREITGRVSEIHDRSATRSRNVGAPPKLPAKLVIAVVELPEGGHARVLLPRGRFVVGAEIPLTLTLYENGDRRVVPRLGAIEQADAADHDPSR